MSPDPSSLGALLHARISPSTKNSVLIPVQWMYMYTVTFNTTSPVWLTSASSKASSGMSTLGKAYIAPCTSLHLTPVIWFIRSCTILAFLERESRTAVFSWMCRSYDGSPGLGGLTRAPVTICMGGGWGRESVEREREREGERERRRISETERLINYVYEVTLWSLITHCIYGNIINYMFMWNGTCKWRCTLYGNTCPGVLGQRLMETCL